MSFIEESLYKQIHSTMPIVCVDILITFNNDILLGKRNNEPKKGEYWLPGGRVHKGESLNQACTRIVKDEFGLVFEPEQFKWISVEESLFAADPFGHGSGTHTVNIVFTIRCHESAKIKLDEKQHSKTSMYPKSGILVAAYIKRLYEILVKKGVINNNV